MNVHIHTFLIHAFLIHAFLIHACRMFHLDVKGPVPGICCFEGGHPIVDENGLAGTQAILDMTAHLTAQDRVLFLISGGGSALFEKPLVSLFTLQEINRQLLV